jgi:hypothetical protein
MYTAKVRASSADDFAQDRATADFCASTQSTMRAGFTIGTVLSLESPGLTINIAII